MPHLHRHHHAGIHSIDYLAYVSGLNPLNSGFKLALSLGTLLLCIGLDRPAVSAAVILSMGFLTVRWGGVKLGDYLSLLRIPLAFLLMGGLAVACDLAAAPIGDWNVPLFGIWITMTGARLRFACALSLRALGAVSALYLLALSTPAGELTGALRRAHLPGLLTELMYLIYRFLFILLDIHGRMRDAARSRLGENGFVASCRTFGATVGNLLVQAIHKSSVYYDAMEARCYDGELRFLEEEKPICRRHLVYTGLFWLALLGLGLAL
jgi:cobalt/nickel transport system permease protein